MRESLIKEFGEQWYSEHWPYVHYVYSMTKNARDNGFKDWMIEFKVGNTTFTGIVRDEAKVIIEKEDKFVEEVIG